MEALNVPDLFRLVEMENRDDAVAELRQALDDDRIWRVSMFDGIGAAALMADPRVAAIVAEARARMAALDFAPRVELVPAPEPGLHPLLLIFHGARGSIEVELPAFRGAAVLGYNVAAAQSSQPSAPGRFCWDPPLERIRQDLRAIAAELPRHGRIVLAGFSQGAWLALMEAMRGDLFQAPAAILVAPFIGDLAHLPPAARRLRVHVVAGADDPLAERVGILEEHLRTQGHHVGVDVVPNLGHDYPPDFADRLPAILASVTRRPDP